MPDAVIFDRAYRHHEGTRLGRRGAIGAVVREGVRRILGLRRKARRKILPWSLIVFAVLPAAALVGIAFFVSQLPTDFELPSHGEYFDLTSFVSLVFVALAGPELLAPDRTQGVLAVYFSRPLRVVDYLGAKAGALAAVVMAYFLFPQLLLYFGQASLAEGFFAYLGDKAEILWQVPLTAVIFLAVHGAVAFAIASLVNRVSVAAGVYLATMAVSSAVAFGLTQATRIPGSRYFALLAVEQHPRILRDWIFGLSSGPYAPTEAGFGPWASLATALVVVAAGLAITYRRLQKAAA